MSLLLLIRRRMDPSYLKQLSLVGWLIDIEQAQPAALHDSRQTDALSRQFYPLLFSILNYLDEHALTDAKGE